MSSSAQGNGNGAGGPKPPGRTPIPVRVDPAGRRPQMVTPEQTCLGCSLGALAVLLVALFWTWFIWRFEMNDDVAPHGGQPPRAQQPYGH